MPVRWTSQNDQLLLLKILETHKLAVDTKKVAESWPKNNPDGVPTPRAISERLFKIRNESKDKGADFSISGGKGPGSAQSTPRKASQKLTPKTPTSKRKREDDTKLEDVLDTPSSKRTFIKNEPQEDPNEIMDAEAFTPRVKREVPVPTPRMGVVPFYGFADQANASDVNTSGSEFAPDNDNYEDDNMA